MGARKDWKFGVTFGGWKRRCLNYAKCKQFCPGNGKKYCIECHERKDYLRSKYLDEQNKENQAS